MNQQKVYVYVQDTWSDWEAGYITAELNTGRFFRNKGERLLDNTQQSVFRYASPDAAEVRALFVELVDELLQLDEAA
jgi:hypothetical protein